jgi:hypothetical protein
MYMKITQSNGKTNQANMNIAGLKYNMVNPECLSQKMVSIKVRKSNCTTKVRRV